MHFNMKIFSVGSRSLSLAPTTGNTNCKSERKGYGTERRKRILDAEGEYKYLDHICSYKARDKRLFPLYFLFIVFYSAVQYKHYNLADSCRDARH